MAGAGELASDPISDRRDTKKKEKKKNFIDGAAEQGCPSVNPSMEKLPAFVRLRAALTGLAEDQQVRLRRGHWSLGCTSCGAAKLRRRDSALYPGRASWR